MESNPTNPSPEVLDLFQKSVKKFKRQAMGDPGSPKGDSAMDAEEWAGLLLQSEIPSEIYVGSDDEDETIDELLQKV